MSDIITAHDVYVVMVYDSAPYGTDELVCVAATIKAAKREAATHVGEKSLTWRRLSSIFDSQDYWEATWNDPDGSVLTFAIRDEQVVS